jgi:MFS family permease
LRSYVVFQCLILLVNASINASAVPLLMVIFPKERYGQFASCNGMMKALAGLVGAAAAGVFIDAVTHRGTHAYNAYAYRWMYAWGAVFAVITSLVTYAQYAMWKRLGGDTAYVAPGSTAALARTGGG